MNALRSRLGASIALVLGVILLGNGAVAQGQSKGPIRPVAASAEQLSFDQPLAWMHEAKTNYSAVKDYTCNLSSQERVNGKLLDQNVMNMKVKTQPFSVYLRWIAPDQDKGQEVAYVEGKNNGKMRVKSKRVPGILGFVSIDPNDPRVTQNSRHSIKEAGIGNMIDQTIKAWEYDRSMGKTKVLPPLLASYNRRDCFKIEVVHLENNGKDLFRSVIFLEKVSKLPIRLENYAWPKQGGPANGELLESFSYFDIQWNVGLADAEFNK